LAATPNNGARQRGNQPGRSSCFGRSELRATPEQLCDALGACTDLKPEYRRSLKMALEQLQFLEQQIGQLDQEMASLLSPHQDAVERLAEVPGLGVDSAQQIIAEVGPTAATFPSEKCLSSWVGACPGDDESAGVNYSHRSPKGNRHMRRLLNQVANATVKTQGSILGIVYRRSVPRLGHNQAIVAIAHRQCRLIWLMLHQEAPSTSCKSFTIQVLHCRLEVTQMTRVLSIRRRTSVAWGEIINSTGRMARTCENLFTFRDKEHPKCRLPTCGTNDTRQSFVKQPVNNSFCINSLVRI
jgi:hypothetical protein